MFKVTQCVRRIDSLEVEAVNRRTIVPDRQQWLQLLVAGRLIEHEPVNVDQRDLDRKKRKELARDA